MVNRQLFDNRLTQLAGYIVDLIESQNMEQQEYLEDKKTQRYIERTLHLAIECCIDIGNHLIADQNWREPLNNKDVFTVLEENGVVSSALLPNLSKMAQFWNILVHDYAKIEPDIVYSILKNNVVDFQKFIKETVEALKSL
jgi:uncharacterized protein YutE (UPF0331/DUF86 family)